MSQNRHNLSTISYSLNIVASFYTSRDSYFFLAKAALLTESRYEGALPKLQDLEQKKFYKTTEKEEIPTVIDKPKFTVQVNGPIDLIEGENVHYECRIEPYPDNNLEVEWFHNGELLPIGHRYRQTSNFGFASLDILSVRPEDSGDYTCIAINQLGQAESTINVDVERKS